jgi:glutamate dehydrogenase (NAD(P)+)
MGGTDYDKEGIAGYGVAIAARTALGFYSIACKGRSYAVQGLGAMGAAVVHSFSQSGAVLKYVSDLSLGGTFRVESGEADKVVELISKDNIEELREYFYAAGRAPLALEQIVYSDVDLFFPCALQDVITVNNVSNVRAKFIVEGANNPCSDASRDTLFEKGVVVIPDFLANPGGIIAAFVELSSSATPEENIESRVNVKKARALTKEKVSANVLRTLEQSTTAVIAPYKLARAEAIKKILNN